MKTDTRQPAVAGRFYDRDPQRLRRGVVSMLGERPGRPVAAVGIVVPHAGLMYSGDCAATVFRAIQVPSIAVILGPNHTGLISTEGGAGVWLDGAFATPLGEVPVAGAFARELVERCDLVEHDPLAHLREHSVEVELPFLQVLTPDLSIVPLVLAWDAWDRCRQLATALADVVRRWPEPVLLVASSDMTHYESAATAERKDRAALAAVERLDGEALLTLCRQENVTMCGRAPTAVVCEASKQLGATQGRVIDYRHSGWVTGDDSSVVGYAGVVIS